MGITNQDMSSIKLISGCMFSGKTTALIQEVRAALARGVEAAVFKNSVDGRYEENSVVTHTSASVPAHIVDTSREIPAAVGNAQLVAIDEAHFFDDALPEVCEALREAGRDVVVTALDRTWKGREFPLVQRLARIADAHEHTLAVCKRCGRPATHSQRTAPFRTPGDFVGGPESYEPRCPECFVPGIDEPGSA
jgi:thymidine kinase